MPILGFSMNVRFNDFDHSCKSAAPWAKVLFKMYVSLIPTSSNSLNVDIVLSTAYRRNCNV